MIPDFPQSQLARELNTLLQALPDDWRRLVASTTTLPTSPTPAEFTISSSATLIANIPTWGFYKILMASQQPTIPSLQYWERTLNPPAKFTSAF